MKIDLNSKSFCYQLSQDWKIGDTMVSGFGAAVDFKYETFDEIMKTIHIFQKHVGILYFENNKIKYIISRKEAERIKKLKAL